MKKLLILALMLIYLLGFSVTQPVFAETMTNGAELFEINCAGCHPNGNNIIRRGKTLKQKALQRNGMDSLDAIATLVSNGKNNMSAFKDRLTTEQIEAVSLYVLSQAEKDWK